MADGEKAAPEFSKVTDLRPASQGHNIVVKVLDSTVVLDRPKGGRGGAYKVTECLVGDESGVIIFSARNEQADVVKKGAVLTLRNSRVDMFRGSMRLVVDQWGKVEEAGALKAAPKLDNNLSLLEFELVPYDHA